MRLRYGLILTFAVGLAALWTNVVGAAQDSPAAKEVVYNSPEGTPRGTTMPPPQPGEETWTFIEKLKSPLWEDHGWITRKAAAKEADLSGGVCVDSNFPDPDGLLVAGFVPRR